MVDTNFFSELNDTLAQIADMIKGAIATIYTFVDCLPDEVGIALGSILVLAVGLTVVEVFT